MRPLFGWPHPKARANVSDAGVVAGLFSDDGVLSGRAMEETISLLRSSPRRPHAHGVRKP